MNEAELLRMICGRVERVTEALEGVRRDVCRVVLLTGGIVCMTLATAAAMVGVMAAFRDKAMSAESVVGVAVAMGAVVVAVTCVGIERVLQRMERHRRR